MQLEKKNNIIDVIVPFFVPPFIGGTETVIRSWGAYLHNKSGKLRFRYINVFGYKDSNFFKDFNSENITYGGFFSNKKLIRKLGLVYLCYHFIVTKADVIIVLSPKYIRLAYFIRKFFKKKYKIISWMHFSLKRVFADNKNDFRLADRHLAISSGIAQQLQDFGVDCSDISVVYNPVEKSDAVIKIANAPHFLYVGRLELAKQKNIGEMLNAIYLFKQKHKNVILEIWGDGEDLNLLEEQVKKLSLENNVMFRGRSSNPWQNIYEGTALILTSTFEGLPMAILESISRGLPVISSDIETGPKDEINEVNGKLYELGDVNQLVEKMEYVYNHPEKYERRKIKSSIEKFYEKNYYTNIVNILKGQGK
ncbi:glycosyltransferase [Pediococcus acidilactici]|uniref:glycosyltransferase n=1 Tax=Pediococcus acidilactici TaxID=1254 RepID=UPI0010584FAB|nr:glycosyltransferase [Pediococcus acidilactici]KAF0514935.1 glycosyltransferase [Pediococcus acidilactici]MCT3036808.1 glycosyltransferase [Pediococcus acidilactici]QQC45232.1 glycosyltransferase [Pediococcus acidilactici]